MGNSVTDVSWCIQGSHSVPRTKMTVVYAGGVKRRMCETCAERWKADKAAKIEGKRKFQNKITLDSIDLTAKLIKT